MFFKVTSTASRHFFRHTVFLKLTVGQFSDTQKPPMVVAERPKIFDVNAFGEGYLCLLKIFLFLNIRRLYFIQFLGEIYMIKVTRTFGRIFWAPIPFKRYQNTSGCGAELQRNFGNAIVKITTTFSPWNFVYLFKV